jgi:lipoprotein-releasing system permease protein
MLPVTLRGIDPAAEGGVSDLTRLLQEGRLADLVPGSDRVLLGDAIAQQLGVSRGDTLEVLVPAMTPDGTPVPKLSRVTVAGVFEAGLAAEDAALLVMDFSDVRALSAAGGEGLRLRFADALAAPAESARIRAILPAGFSVIDWTVDNASYFRAIRIEKTMMSLILLLIVAVAAFNIVAMLVMTVTDKRTDIAILRTLGGSPRAVMGVFMIQGLVIGWAGVLLGTLLGVVLTLNVGTIEPFLERVFRFHLFDPDVYYVTIIPEELHRSNVAWIAAAALLLTTLATVYPALRAARVPRAEALRYE